jgi:DNA-binding protein H-NS
MTKTYVQIKKQIEALQREAAQLRESEVRDVIGRIREAIDSYGLTAEDLGFGSGSKVAARTARNARASKARTPAGVRQPKFRDANGNVWGGRGPRPRWLRDALAAGKELSSFAT